ncbi:TetR/AcrR family transcriptional regulator [Pseudonocardia spinosispora]|uniref:TetR/AcrR family transcriptional regulator n=1 Tax=Pseudonocardia spinosispora TaxID=103441 RepID=UPI0003F8CF6F|nr:TetR family transcriptional regulator [Pseudonocardia spinosispora]
MPRSAAKTGRPARISAAGILAAARAILERDGVSGLTMRKVATEVGTTPMALYHHVRNKDELLLLLLDDYADAIPRPALPEAPRERILVVARAMHDALAECPWIVEVLVADDLVARSGLWYSEHIVRACLDLGFDAERAVATYRGIWYFTAGEIIVRASATRRREAENTTTYRDRLFADLDAEAFPTLAALGSDWARLTSRDTYPVGLHALIDGLLAG